jgi:OHCU decarboxylase
MTVSLDELNALPQSEAEELFSSVCGASSWIIEMARGRPYDSVDQLLAKADEAWASTGPDDWYEAFSHHPRIGEGESAAGQNARAKGWSEKEQALIRGASSNVFDQMSLVNRAYEEKFGFIYIVSAAGKSGDELLELARERLRNDTDTELRIAAGEQAKIMRLRLEKLFEEE